MSSSFINIIFVQGQAQNQKKLFLKRRPIFLDLFNFIYNYNQKLLMLKKQSWSQEEDKLLQNFISNYFTGNTKIKWSEISESLQEINPNWIRSGKQCRERWLNHLCSSLQKSEDLDHNEIQQLLNLMREHGKKWQFIAKEMPQRSANFIKNFFYAALRKGLRNLNRYNNQFRSERIYKVYSQDFTKKLLSVHDSKKSQDLHFSDHLVFELAQEIRESLISCSQSNVRTCLNLTTDLIQFYERLNQKILNFSKICRYKKMSKKDKKEKDQKHEKFTIKLSRKTNPSNLITEKNTSKQQGQQINSINIESIGIQSQKQPITIYNLLTVQDSEGNTEQVKVERQENFNCQEKDLDDIESWLDIIARQRQQRPTLFQLIIKEAEQNNVEQASLLY